MNIVEQHIIGDVIQFIAKYLTSSIGPAAITASSAEQNFFTINKNILDESFSWIIEQNRSNNSTRWQANFIIHIGWMLMINLYTLFSILLIIFEPLQFCVINTDRLVSRYHPTSINCSFRLRSSDLSHAKQDKFSDLYEWILRDPVGHM